MDGLDLTGVAAAPNKYSHLLFLIVIAVNYFQPNKYSRDVMPRNISEDEILTDYDFIIIGCGSAGLVLESFILDINVFKLSFVK